MSPEQIRELDIVIVNWNAGALLGRCIESIAQSEGEAADGITKLLVLREIAGGSPAIIRTPAATPTAAPSPRPEALSLPIPPDAATSNRDNASAAPQNPPANLVGWPSGTGRIVNQATPPPSPTASGLRGNTPVVNQSAPAEGSSGGGYAGELDAGYRARAVSSFYGSTEPPPKPLEEMTEAERDAYLIEKSRLQLDGLHLRLQDACKARGNC